jgi:hypothetical protein
VSSRMSSGGPRGGLAGESWCSRAPVPLGCPILSNRMSISQCGVCGNRSTATALTGRKGVPFTRLDGALQRL